MKMYYSEQKLSIIYYNKFKGFNNGPFVQDLQTLLTKSFHENQSFFRY